jgi:hypothetical protein
MSKKRNFAVKSKATPTHESSISNNDLVASALDDETSFNMSTQAKRARKRPKTFDDYAEAGGTVNQQISVEIPFTLTHHPNGHSKSSSPSRLMDNAFLNQQRETLSITPENASPRKTAKRSFFFLPKEDRICSNCQTTVTSLWRKSVNDEYLCNGNSFQTFFVTFENNSLWFVLCCKQITTSVEQNQRKFKLTQ